MSGNNARVVLEGLERDPDVPALAVDEIHADGEDVVVIGRGEDGARVAHRCVVRDGRIASARSYADPAEGLRDAGLAASTARDVELVRRHYAAFNRSDLEGVIATLHPSVEIFGSDERGGGAGERFRGRDEAAAFFAEIKKQVADNEVRPLSIDASPGRVQVSVRLHGTLRSSQRTGSLPAVHFFTLEDGLILRIETYRPNWRTAL